MKKMLAEFSVRLTDNGGMIITSYPEGHIGPNFTFAHPNKNTGIENLTDLIMSAKGVEFGKHKETVEFDKTPDEEIDF